MFLPDFIFEDEDISVLKRENIFLSEYVDKLTSVRYFKLNIRKLRELIDLIYGNRIVDDRDKSNMAFDIKVVANIFSGIIMEKDNLSITQSILEYHRINPANAKRLMDCIRYR